MGFLEPSCCKVNVRFRGEFRELQAPAFSFGRGTLSTGRQGDMRTEEGTGHGMDCRLQSHFTEDTPTRLSSMFGALRGHTCLHLLID